MTEANVRWYRRLQVQLWLWAILPVTLVLVAIAFAGVRGHELSMYDFVAERDTTMAWLLGRQIDDDLAHGLLMPDGANLASAIGDARIGRRGVIYVLDGAGRVLFHPDPNYLGRDLSADPLVRQMLGSTTGSGSGRLADGSPTLASFAKVGDTGWRVVIEEPLADIIVPILRVSSVLPALVVMAGILSLIVIFFSVRTIVRPLQRLSEKAKQITGGDLGNLDQEVGGVEEIRQLHHALRDMVERIRHYQESMRDYIEGITRGQETERARLSRELHDETVQALVAIGQRAQLAQRALEHDDAQPVTEGLQQIRSLCQGALDELRHITRALRPVYLEELGFLPALEALVDDVRHQGLSAEMLVHGDPRRLSPEAEIAAYRLVQEALNNAVHHAQAKQVTLSVEFQEHELALTVEDNGQGMVLPENPESLTEVGHLGLVGMRERALLLGGKLEIQSQPGEGTRISARLPL